MKKALVLIVLLLGLAGCTSTVTAHTRTAAPATETPLPSPTILPSPTETPSITLTATPMLPEINPATSATTWPADVQARFEDVLTNPWLATADQKAAYDMYLTMQWQLTLKAEGVANAETLQGYDLLNAIIDHLPPVTLMGDETPEQLASYVVELPFSLHKLIRIDQNNLVPFHHEDGRYIEGEIDPKTGTDGGYYYANFGLGGTTSPHRDRATLVRDANMWSNDKNFGFYFYGEKIPAATSSESIEGDAMFLFRIPGMDPTSAVGVMIRMYDGPQTHYAEAFLPLSTVFTTHNDTCVIPKAGYTERTAPCPDGYSFKAVSIEDSFTGTQARVTLLHILKLMSLYKNPHISLRNVNGVLFSWAWKDGISMMNDIATPNLPNDFINTP